MYSFCSPRFESCVNTPFFKNFCLGEIFCISKCHGSAVAKFVLMINIHMVIRVKIEIFPIFFPVSSWIQNSSRSQIPHGSAHWYCCIPLRRVRKSFYHSRQIATSSKISSFKRAPTFMRMVWKRFLARAQTCGASAQSPHWRKTIQMQYVRPEIHRFKVCIQITSSSQI